MRIGDKPRLPKSPAGWGKAVCLFSNRVCQFVPILQKLALLFGWTNPGVSQKLHPDWLGRQARMPENFFSALFLAHFWGWIWYFGYCVVVLIFKFVKVEMFIKGCCM